MHADALTEVGRALPRAASLEPANQMPFYTKIAKAAKAEVTGLCFASFAPLV